MAQADQYVMFAVYVPAAYTEAVCAAMCDAGAGTVEDGHYDRVTYVSHCVGHYRVLDKAWNQAGPAGQEHKSEEDRIEAICRRDRVEAVVKAVVAVHCYETPAIAVYPILTGEYKYWSD